MKGECLFVLISFPFNTIPFLAIIFNISNTRFLSIVNINLSMTSFELVQSNFPPNNREKFFEQLKGRKRSKFKIIKSY